MNNKKLCSTCKVGCDTYLLDSRDLFCPYLNCHDGKSCSEYKPLKEENRTENDKIT